MPQSQAPHRRLAAGLWYQRLPCDPPPAEVARRLTEASVASKAAKRIDSYERYASQHVEHRRAVVRGVLGAAGLVLSIAPGVPSLFHACGASRDLECGLRVMAMAGGALALTVTGWAFYDLYRQPAHFSDHVAKLNAEMARSMQSRNGDVAVERLFDLYRGMSRHEQLELKSYLHERAAEPKEGPLTLSGVPPAPASLTTVPPSTRSDDELGDDLGDVASEDGGSPRWHEATERQRSLEEAASLPPEPPPAALLPPGSPRPWHGVTLRRSISPP